ncbi:hypothetical protein [Pseudozobellia thermophila]|uniref:DUF4179 domain-containing protein n=1 Tax=Pseudozobellia thermophila TaxID=192903 RepID=A0A1M6MIR0_9FLAO|nr:hypothetical protein [Pseudozobellia thermophila]SHJ83294.1 hypothetical protein SAMN04488513_1104 [Pseudozobellia thermophila]
MEGENLEKLFDELRGKFDYEEPEAGHEIRFREKLDASRGTISLQGKRTSVWKPVGIAASIVAVCALALIMYPVERTIEEQVAQISPEVSRTEFYFTNLIEEQVVALQKERTPETRKLIEDAMVQLNKLEKNYTQLERDLIEGGNSKLILSAMITNFQTRINLLQDVLERIENIKNIKSYDNEATL